MCWKIKGKTLGLKNIDPRTDQKAKIYQVDSQKSMNNFGKNVTNKYHNCPLMKKHDNPKNQNWKNVVLICNF